MLEVIAKQIHLGYPEPQAGKASSRKSEKGGLKGMEVVGWWVKQKSIASKDSERGIYKATGIGKGCAGKGWFQAFKLGLQQSGLGMEALPGKLRKGAKA